MDHSRVRRDDVDAAAMDSPLPRGVCVFAPSTIVTVTIEHAGGDDEVHFHAGGQGFWIARMLGRLGVPTTLCTVFGGESGRVAAALVDAEPIEVRAVVCGEANGAWIHDRRDGDRRPVAEVTGPALGRHETDDLVGAALASALNLGMCVLAGPQDPNVLAGSHYRRLAADLAANGVEVIADLSRDALRSALAAGLDFCKVSEEDLAGGSTEAVQPPAVEVLAGLTSAGARNAVITRGDEPAVASIEGQLFEVSAPRLTPVDHRGAGDALTAVVAAGRYWGLDWLEALRWGTAAGALTVARRGLATADRHDIHQILDRVGVRRVPSR